MGSMGTNIAYNVFEDDWEFFYLLENEGGATSKVGMQLGHARFLLGSG
jgi:hypothetical protein